MNIHSLHIQNFKSFRDVTIDLNADINIFTGTNNSGKTTVLEAIALWQECFAKLLQRAKVGRSGKRATSYQKGDYILGNTQNKYFPFDQITSVRSPNFSDIFYQRNTSIPIVLGAALRQDKQELNISFEIRSSGSTYVIVLKNFSTYDFAAFNAFFKKLPNPIGILYASPVSAIQQIEDFTTAPIIKANILKRESVSVLRNRLYAIYHHTDRTLYTNFLRSLNDILFDNQTGITFHFNSDAQRDTRVVIEFQIGTNDTQKDIALLGSGSLQVVEILLSLYYSEEPDMNLILLDEPDSHIHRDIQKRLLHTITEFSTTNQVFLTTHNESLIRAASPEHLFHLEHTPRNHYRPLNHKELAPIPKTSDKKSFKGIYPLSTNAIIRSLGDSTGLDFINAIEADRIIFVEGEDDAKALHILLQRTSLTKNTTKYVFWVLNGISNVFREIAMYKRFFSQIKNRKSLWEKSVLIMDRDFLTDEHSTLIKEELTQSFLPTYMTEAYTLESTLCADFEKTGMLLHLWLKDQDISSDKQDIENVLRSKYSDLGPRFQRLLENNNVHDTVQRYRAARDHCKELFGKKKIIDLNDIALTTHYQDFVNQCIKEKTFYKIMRKDDVEYLINAVLQPYSITFTTEKNFTDVLKNISPNLWLSEWDFLKNIGRLRD
ncbi:MAG: AAA family ATPase [Candidatus Kapabacteria bacterium]|jgi:AAA15 family ATPase/GTPase|nr:AAA family ATPase [Candidatus Kapabacteria bacterium]